MPLNFAAEFLALTGNAPFPWQQALYDNRFSKGDFPSACAIPTGLGKTAVVAVWLLALAANPAAVPRRLVYVVSRRTVIDQATAEAERYHDRLTTMPELQGLVGRLRGLCAGPAGVPLALSTLRGRFADDREWAIEPARPAVVVGTVDTVGSRLLFSGSGCCCETRPVLAGLLGQDTLLVLDEAQPEPAFEQLVRAVRDEQQRGGEFRPFHVTALTADPRATGDVFRLGKADWADASVKRRVGAAKALHLHALEDGKRTAAELAARALAFQDSGRAVLVFARSFNAVQQVVQLLVKEKPLAGRVEQLTGAIRGRERDRLAAENRVFARFLPPGDRRCEPRDGPVYLVCAGAGEVGASLSADHLVCDLTPFDGMAQRFGRANRFGDQTGTEVHVLHPTRFDPSDPLGPACEQTLALLRTLAGSASPAALASLDDSERRAASTPPPALLATTDILFDAWALTTARGRLPGRPPVGPFLRGLAGWEPPETHVAWREEVTAVAPVYPSEGERVARQAADRGQVAAFASDLLGDYPLVAHELLRDATTRVASQLAVVARRAPHLPAWLLHADGTVTVHTVADLADEKEKDQLASRTVVLPAAAGGLSDGMLLGAATAPDGCDVADQWLDPDGRPLRQRTRGDVHDPDPPPGMWLVREYDTDPAAGDADGVSAGPSRAGRAGGRYFRWYAAAAAGRGSGPERAPAPPAWPHLTAGVARAAGRIAAALFPDRPDLRRVLTAAGRLQGLGKLRGVWQRSIGNRSASTAYEAGGRGMRPVELTSYRPEFGSLLDAHADPAFAALESDDERELALHLVAAQHGRARPHFPADEAFDPERPATVWAAAAREVPRRFAAQQHRYGRWGLAYLESLLRAAVYAAGAGPAAPGEESA